MTSLPASDSGSAAIWGSKKINPRPQLCLCLTWSGYPSNNNNEDDAKGYFFSKEDVLFKINHNIITKLKMFRIIIREQFFDLCEFSWFYFFFIKYLIESGLHYSNSKTNFLFRGCWSISKGLNNFFFFLV